MEPKRPYTPVSVQVEVALRQLGYDEARRAAAMAENRRRLGELLRWALTELGLKRPELDHDPALARRIRCPRTGRYTPAANDPAYLRWIEAADHLVKTAGRGGDRMRFGGDTREAAKTARLERAPERRKLRRRLKRRFPKMKIPSRPFPAGRKLRKNR